MKKALSMLLATLVALSAMLAYATVPAFADDDDDDDEAALRLSLLASCVFDFSGTPPFLGVGETDFPEDEDFFVNHGWGFSDWSQFPEDQGPFQAPTTRFDLLVDGESVGPDEVTFEIDVGNDFAAKSFITNFDDDDAEDTHVFTGMWFLDGLLVGGTPGQAVLIFLCDLTVHFVEFDDDDDDD